MFHLELHGYHVDGSLFLPFCAFFYSFHRQPVSSNSLFRRHKLCTSLAHFYWTQKCTTLSFIYSDISITITEFEYKQIVRMNFFFWSPCKYFKSPQFSIYNYPKYLLREYWSKGFAFVILQSLETDGQTVNEDTHLWCRCYPMHTIRVKVCLGSNDIINYVNGLILLGQGQDDGKRKITRKNKNCRSLENDNW